jgi:hypothetical protein
LPSRLEDLLDQSAVPQFAVDNDPEEEGNAPLDQTFAGSRDWGTQNLTMSMHFTGQHK